MKTASSPQYNLHGKIEDRLKKPRTDIAQMSLEKIQQQAYESQAYQIELERQNGELRKVQLQLHAANERHQKLYDNAPIGFLSLNQHLYINDANQTCCELFKHAKNDLLNTKFRKYIHLEDQNCVYLFFKHLFSTPRKQSIEFRLKSADAYPITIACQGYYCDANSTHNEFFLILQDISKQKHIEQAVYQLNDQLKQKVFAQSAELLSKNTILKENLNEIKHSKQQLIEREAKLNSIFNAAVEGIITIDQDGIIESTNKSVVSIFGYQAKELIGKNINKLMPAPHSQCHKQYLKNYLTKKQAKIIGSTRQLEGLRKDGSRVPIDLSISTYKIGDKRYFTGMIRDITERKRKEQLDKQHLDELAHVTRLVLMGEMASGIAHEVNQPLAAIATYSQVAIRLLENEPLDSEELGKTLQKTEQQAQRAGQIISRMRQFISTNTLHRSTIDINTLVEDALCLAYDSCQQLAIQCALDLTTPLPCISADSIQIEQVLLNLIKNSTDALSKLPKDQPRKLSIQTYRRQHDFIEVRVKDNGPGIKAPDIAKIFTPFFTTNKFGMGMGLSICRSLIKSHGGELHFNSSRNRGTTFYFTLPLPENNHEN